MMTFKKGFTLIEALIALLIITTSLVAVFSLLTQTIGFLPLSQQRLTAYYLAQEGMELIRNLRDTNVIVDLNWNNGLKSCSSGCEIDYLGQLDDLTPWAGGRFLRKTGAAGLYNYVAGTETMFKREITITPHANDWLEILVEIFWSEKGRNHQASVRGIIYAW